MQIDTIVTDLDDTLLDGNRTISPYTMEIIGEAKSRGIRLIPASGRAASSMRPFIDQLQTGQPYIACNGAQLMNPDHSEISTSAFTPEQARALVRYFQDKGFHAQVYRGDFFYFANPNEESRTYTTQTGMQGKAVGDLVSFLDFPTPKVLSINAPRKVEALLPVIQADFPDISFTISKPYFLEAQPGGVTKGSALRQLSRIANISPERTMVFGDSLNDVSMLEFTEHSVAVANARDDVKRAARYITEFPNTQDGLARFVKTHVLD